MSATVVPSIGGQSLPSDLLAVLRPMFPPARLAYIAAVLTADELRIIPEPADALILARIKRMPVRRLTRFDAYIPLDRQEQKRYEQTQVRWIADEEYLLGLQLGRRPTARELANDFVRHNNGLRFRAYYTLKFPQRMRRRDDRPARRAG